MAEQAWRHVEDASRVQTGEGVVGKAARRLAVCNGAPREVDCVADQLTLSGEALVFLATDTLGAGGSAVGLLLAAVGIGLLAGYALLARTPARVPMVALLLVGFAVSSAGNLLTGLAGAVMAAFLVQAVRGLGIAGMDVAANTVLQRIVPPALLGRVFGSLYGAIGVAAALAYLLGGLLLDRTTPRITFVIAGAGGLLATLATAAALRHAIREPHPDPLPPDSNKEPAG